MQIIREALNNAVKHAHAGQIRVRLRHLNEGEAIIDISDNGVGWPDNPERENHFGLHIMRERAEYLGGTLRLESSPSGGARVQLRFVPAAGRTHSPTAVTSEANHG
jgi:two-component system nitrate/nitrite sensor histidine kinase NarX